MEKILEQKEKGLQTVLFSLGIGSQMIFTKEERCQLLEKAGVDVLIECPLDNRIRHMKAETFIKEILVGDLQAEHVAVGEDFRFGYERKGTPQLLETMGRKLGFTVDVVPKEMEGRRKISSTFIREELKKGNMEKVNDLLGIPFFVDGVIEHGRGMGHKVLLPTTNIVPAKEKLMPPNGVYDTVSHFKDRTLCGITNVGLILKTEIIRESPMSDTSRPLERISWVLRPIFLTVRRICTESPAEWNSFIIPDRRSAFRP